MKRSEMRGALLRHYERHPQMQPQDLFKFIYQSAFGCEHAISSLEEAVARIEAEAVDAPPQDLELLAGDYGRVPLSYLRDGLTPATFGRLFLASAKKETGGRAALEDLLESATEMVAEGVLSFEETAFKKAVADWAAAGYPAIRHSEVFRASDHPSYRVIAKEYLPFLPLLTALDKRLERGRLCIALEGGSASGKTTLSRLLERLYDCAVIHMDDFFLRPEQRTAERYAELGGNIDRERFLEEVLLPMHRGETVRYRKFDCAKMELGEETTLPTRRLTVIEGAYSMHPAFAEYYDFSVFLEIEGDFQKKRILRRNTSPMAKRFFDEWIPLEQRYFEGLRVRERCGLIIPVRENYN